VNYVISYLTFSAPLELNVFSDSCRLGSQFHEVQPVLIADEGDEEE